MLIYDLEKEELIKVLEELGEPDYRINQLWQGLYKQIYQNFSEFSGFPKDLRNKLENRFSLNALKNIVQIQSKDKNTEKVLFELNDGEKIETVLMRYNNRRSLCISTQSGCAMGCVFCATGQMGFRRNLSCGEIISQVLYFEKSLQEKKGSLSNIVVMGMGEPFHNYDATISAIRVLNDHDGFNMGARRFTVSTVGMVPKIMQFADEGFEVNLAISLHAATNQLRDSLVPMNRIYPIEKLIEACNYYVNKTNRRVTFEYALINGINESLSDAESLASLLKGMLCHVNLISLNPTDGYKHSGSSSTRVDQFKDKLIESHIPTTIRLRRGIEIQAGCGQLAYQESNML